MTSRIGKRRAAARSEGGRAYHKRRREVKAAAAKVFDERGFRGTTISAIAEELGIDRASVYYYIANKEELFDDVIRESAEENIATVRRIQRSRASPPDKLYSVCRELMESYGDKHYPLLYVFIRENLNQVARSRTLWAQQMKDLGRAYEQSVIAIIEQGYADGSLRNIGSARTIAFGIIGMLGWTNRWYRPEQSTLSAREIGEVYAELVVSGLRSGQPSTQRKQPERAAMNKRAVLSKKNRRRKASD